MSDAITQSGKAARVSMWIAFGTPALLLTAFLLMFVFESLNQSGNVGGIFGLFLFAAPIAHCVGVVFGIVAMAKRDRARLGALGAGLNVAMIALGAALVAWLVYVAAGAIHMN